MWVSDNAALDTESELSIELWLRPDTLQGVATLVEKWGTAPGESSANQYRLWLDDGRVNFTLQQADRQQVSLEADEIFDRAEETADDSEEAPYQWTHLAVVADSSDEAVRMYKNGFEVDRGSYDGTINDGGGADVKMGAGYRGEIHELPERAHVEIRVYHILGRRVADLVDEPEHVPGQFTVAFGASRLASGVYFYRMRARDVEGNVFEEVRTMTLVR